MHTDRTDRREAPARDHGRDRPLASGAAARRRPARKTRRVSVHYLDMFSGQTVRGAMPAVRDGPGLDSDVERRKKRAHGLSNVDSSRADGIELCRVKTAADRLNRRGPPRACPRGLRPSNSISRLLSAGACASFARTCDNGNAWHSDGVREQSTCAEYVAVSELSSTHGRRATDNENVLADQLVVWNG